MTPPTHYLQKRKPELLLDIPDHIIENACAAYWNTGLYPGQLEWIDLVQREDHRVPDTRLAIQAALSIALTNISSPTTYNQIEEQQCSTPYLKP